MGQVAGAAVRLAIVGPGLIGTSVALAARRAWTDLDVVLLGEGDALGAAERADVVLLAAPVDAIVSLIRSQSHTLAAPLILDTGSTKRAIVAAAAEAGLATFVGGHPMAGAAVSGPSLARADLFDGKPWFLVPGHAAADAVARASAFVTALGAAPVLCPDDGTEHDRIMAAVSHLPQLVASALMAVVGHAAGESGLRWAGGGLRDTTRLASSDPTVWHSVLASNADELAPLVLRLSDDLRTLAGRLEDPAAITRLFDTAARYRRSLD